jgi:hypothetical protein
MAATKPGHDDMHGCRQDQIASLAAARLGWPGKPGHDFGGVVHYDWNKAAESRYGR